MSFLRPNTALVERKIATARSLTNEPINAIATVYPALACRIEGLSVQSRSGGNLEVTIEGVQYLATDIAVIDGLTADLYLGVAPGKCVVINGVEYVVSGDGRGAFVDVRVNDRVTDENGNRYLVLAVNRYGDIVPNLQARLAYGREWSDAAS